MSNLYVYFAIFGLFLSSCTEDVVVNENNLLFQEGINDDDSLNYYVNKEGALVFATLKDYSSFTKSLIEMNQDEFLTWEKRLHFQSLRTHVDSILEEVTQLKYIDKDIKVLEPEISKYLYYDKDTIVQPVIGSLLYRSILNKDGVFYIGSAKHIVDQECVRVYDAEKQNVEIERFNYTNKGKQTKGEYGNVVESPVISRYGYSGVLAKYRTATWYRMYKNVATDAGGNRIFTINMDIMAEGFTAADVLGGRWWGQDTDVFTISDFIVHITGLGLNLVVDESGKRVTKEDEMWFLHPVKSRKCSRFTNTYILKESYGNEISMFLTEPVCLHYKVSRPMTYVIYEKYNPLVGEDPQNCGHKKLE